LNTSLLNVLKYTGFLAIGVFLMWWAYRDVDFNDIANSLSKAHWVWIVIALVLNYTATAIRGIRWNTMLEPLGYQANTWTCIHSVAFGYLMNDLVPRSGEVARCTLLHRAEKIPVDKLIGTVILERIVDIVMLLVVLLLAVLLNGPEINILFAQVDGGKGMLLVYLLIAGVVGLIGLFVVLRLFQNIPFVQRVTVFLKGIGNGLKSVLLLRRKSAFLAYTLGIWGTWLIMTQCMMFALEETQTMTLNDSLFLMAAASLGMIIPTQGGLGAYHYVTMLAFVALGYANAYDPSKSDVGLLFAAISWSGKTILELIMGTIGFLVVSARKTKA
jgi:glycosyltransferase 2 family protein